MKRVWKYDVLGDPPSANDTPVIRMPRAAQILTVQVQNGWPRLWALVDDDAPGEDVKFLIVGTGEPVLDFVTDYVGSWQSDGGAFVFHLFEITREETS